MNMVDNVLNIFESTIQESLPRFFEIADNLAYILLFLQVVIFGLELATQKYNDVPQLLWKVFVTMATFFVVHNYSDLAIIFNNSMSQIAGVVGDFDASGVDITRPSNIMNYAYNDIIHPVEVALTGKGFLGTTDILVSIWVLLIQVAVMLSFTFIVLQYIIAVIEFNLILAMGTIMVPFILFKPTEFIGSKAFSAIVGQGIKLGIVSLITGLAIVVYKQTVFIPTAEQLDFGVVFQLVSVSLIICFVTMQAPGLAAALISGTPSLGAASLAQNVASIVSTIRHAGRMVNTTRQTLGRIGSMGAKPGAGIESVMHQAMQDQARTRMSNGPANSSPGASSPQAPPPAGSAPGTGSSNSSSPMNSTGPRSSGPSASGPSPKG